MFECCLSLQGSFDDFTESSAMLLFALKRRRFYMSESDQEFSSTAGLMLDGEEPPSTTFCIPQSSTGEVKLSFAGDVIGGFLEYLTNTRACMQARTVTHTHIYIYFFMRIIAVNQVCSHSQL